MKLPFTYPAIIERIVAYRETARNRVIANRRKYVSGIINHASWRSICEAAQVRLIMVDRASKIADTACGWLIAQSFKL